MRGDDQQQSHIYSHLSPEERVLKERVLKDHLLRTVRRESHYGQVEVGCLPFNASDPMEWVHCHIAKQTIPPGEIEPRASLVLFQKSFLKLLAKNPEERYQTAAGVASDLRRCLDDLQREQRVHDFALGDHDRPDYLQTPEKLYGRECKD